MGEGCGNLKLWNSGIGPVCPGKRFKEIGHIVRVKQVRRWRGTKRLSTNGAASNKLDCV